MRCPYCSNAESKVLDKRDSVDGGSIRRRRECLRCSKRYTTHENVQIALSVIKKDGSKQEFDRDKILSGLQRACEKRPMEAEEISRLAEEIESELLRREKAEIKSSMIGNLVMKKLEKLDKVAYLRFASVYKEFDDTRSFEEELSKLKKAKSAA